MPPTGNTYQRSAPAKNRRAADAAWKLGEILAPKITTTMAHLRAELSTLDGWPSATMGDGTPRGGNDLTAVERGAQSRIALGGHLAQIEDDLSAVCSLIDSLGHTLDSALRHRAPALPSVVPAVCRDAQHGKDGLMEWGDPLCTRLPVRAGLCSACYQRERRWRSANNLGERVA